MILEQKQKLKIASKTENISRVEKLIDEICSTYNINQDYYGNILIALTEAVNNAIMHGNKSNPEKAVDISFQSTDKQLEFTVTDQGQGFDYSQLPDPTNPENIEKPNGRGVFLMRNLADKVEFADNGRCVTLGFNIAS